MSKILKTFAILIVMIGAMTAFGYLVNAFPVVFLFVVMALAFIIFFVLIYDSLP